MRFVLRMAWRETRAVWRRLLFFYICVAVGVGAIVALRSIIQNVRTTLVGEARAIFGADVVIDTGRPWKPEDGTHCGRGRHSAGTVRRHLHSYVVRGEGDAEAESASRC